MTNQTHSICPLCNSLEVKFYLKDKKREYLICNSCELIYVPKSYHLTSVEERSRYVKHDNSIDDPSYLNFLSRIVGPLLSNITNIDSSEGLDFGCGPGPVLKKILEKSNLVLEEYDLYFKNDKELLKRNWDFIVSTEVVEHLIKPGEVLIDLWKIINEKGFLAIMTRLYDGVENFNAWYYKGDPTHICFFSKNTFNYLAQLFNCEIQFFDKDIIILKKK
ncbi:methyltransferase domain-containing protein [Thiospirochaeta perfilievii]|uniref:Methyltransferase domain-containing protein n=1 Tax=Thiospirochaeta perfilievii TaxID=252967 RepID=A0A5C1QDD8_9SPIO|nr:methyltransferase domain-containing protein [Thiospirochaeta perfilievii]QEN06095.1 methyltransferase domain-containing protein [Thiospirochaeta perfilievii]